jgi:hypothetical protein
MSIDRPISRRKGRPAAALALPPADAWPPPEALLSRAALAELFGVSVPTFRGWERRGKGPPRGFAHDQEPRYLCREAREWLEREVRRQETFARVSRCLTTLIEEPEESPVELVEPVEQREVRAPEPTRSVQPVWQVLDDDLDPFATARSTRRRPSGYFAGG